LNRIGTGGYHAGKETAPRMARAGDHPPARFGKSEKPDGYRGFAPFVAVAFLEIRLNMCEFSKRGISK
jgi:hypothetical protein